MRKVIPLFLLIISVSFKSFSTPALSSLPSAKATIFLDFDGHYVYASVWNGGQPINCAPSGFNEVQITEVFNRVSEDYRPFNVNVTTDSTVFMAAPLTQRIRVVVTTTSNWYPNVGGVAYTRSFTWGDDTPAFAFVDKLNYSPKNVAECCTHESGHTLGLSHQAKYNGSCTLVSTYNDGLGAGETGWAPVMGNSYGKNLSGWNNGPTPNGCTSDQDNLSIITALNGFTYREDDHGNDLTNASEIRLSEADFSAEGIITTNTDKDVFRFDLLQDGNFKMNASPFSTGPNNAGANLDVKVTIMNAAQEIVGVYDPQTILNVSIDTTLATGTYYVVIEGAGNLYASNYGSLGSYTLSGNYKANVVMPVSRVQLSGEVNKDKHDLSWDIISNVALKNITLENSLNGTDFTALNDLSLSARHYEYAPGTKGSTYYRLKVTSINDQVSYSNVISVKAAESAVQLITITSMVTNEIVVNSPEDYQYRLSDMNGRVIKTGKGKPGISQINIQNSPNGIYIIQIISNSQRSTKRIVRL